MTPKMLRFHTLHSQAGNVVVELVFSITLMAAIAVPAITSLATVITARNYAENSAVQLARTWTISTVSERDQSVAEVKDSLIRQSPYPMTLSTRCIPDCQRLGGIVSVTSRISTGIDWIGVLQFTYELESNKYAP